MANATTNTNLVPYGKGGRHVILPVKGATHLYEGRMVATSGGLLVPGGSGGPCIGVMTHEQNNTGADGDKKGKIETDAIFCLPNATAGDACDETLEYGAVVYMKDDHTIAKGSNSGAWQPAGEYRGMEEDGKVRVFVNARTHAEAEDVGALVDNTGGVGNQTLEAFPVLGAAPADATALRNDITTNLYPALKNNYADLAKQLNSLRTILRNAGLMA